MRILFVTNHYPPRHVGGYELYCARTARSLRDGGHEVRVLSTGDPDDAGDVVRGLVLDPPHLDLAARRTNRALIAGHAARFDAQLAVVWNTYGLHHDAVFDGLAGIPATCYLMLHDLAYYGPEGLRGLRLIASSQVIRYHFLRRGFAAGALPLIYPGVDIPHPGRPHAKAAGIRLLFCGRLVSYKGPHVILQALEHLPEWYELTIVGGSDTDTGYAESLVQRVRDRSWENRVTFAGVRSHEETLREYSRHDILVFPSLWEEPLGLVVLEAMAAGLPVAASRRGAPAELVTHGRTGLLHRPGDPEGLAQSLRSLADPDRRAELGEAARNEVILRFSFDRFMRDFETELRALAGR